MKKVLFSLLLLFMMSVASYAQIVKGDMNDDGTLNISDVVSSVNVILGNQPMTTVSYADIVDPYLVDNSKIIGTWYKNQKEKISFNDDNTTDYSDAVGYGYQPNLGRILLYDSSGLPYKKVDVAFAPGDTLYLDFVVYTRTQPDYSGTIDGHDYVDLGLTSGTLWATMNVGATKVEDDGDHVAWGETSPKNEYTWETYKYSEGDYNLLTKYCNNSEYGYEGFVDNQKELLPEDDAACVHWGDNWRTPTDSMWIELVKECDWTWVTQNRRTGCKVSSKVNGNSIFLPAAGVMYKNLIGNRNHHGYYLSSTLNGGSPYSIRIVEFYNGGHQNVGYFRQDGLSVRPVRVK
jgi:hypothetical protein